MHSLFLHREKVAARPHPPPTLLIRTSDMIYPLRCARDDVCFELILGEIPLLASDQNFQVKRINQQFALMSEMILSPRKIMLCETWSVMAHRTWRVSEAVLHKLGINSNVFVVLPVHL